jgi:hypothetical protein
MVPAWLRIVTNTPAAGQHPNPLPAALKFRFPATLGRVAYLPPSHLHSVEFIRNFIEGGHMRIHFTRATKILTGALLALGLFAGGYVAGQNRFGQPKTILHVVELKWNPAATDADKQRALEGIKDMAAKVPGIKNIWIKGERMQPRDFNAAYAIEFRDRDAADAYAESKVHAAWELQYVPLREASISIQVTNP